MDTKENGKCPCNDLPEMDERNAKEVCIRQVQCWFAKAALELVSARLRLITAMAKILITGCCSVS